MNFLKTKLTAVILVVVLIGLLTGFTGQQEETTITKTFYVKSKTEALKIAEDYLCKDWNYILISKTIWQSDIKKGYKYEIRVTKHER